MTSDQIAFSLLGPLDVRVAGRSLAIGGTKPRMLLATLLLHANRVVTTDLLIEVLWPQQPPRSAAANLRTYVSSLRTGPGQVGSRIRAQRSGYAIDVESGELDMLTFEDLVNRARQDRADDRPHEALDQMQQALALWRGSPLEDLPGSRVWDSRLETLAETRLTVAEELLALRVRLGQHSAAITELRGLLVEHPFQEGLWRQLMLALHRSGRQAEALDAYTEVRRRLVSELGIEPSVELRRIHAAILAGESPDVQDWENTAAAPRVGPPQQLPADTPDFTGRDEDVHTLVTALSVSERPLTDPPAIAVVVGPPGVGKSTLAVHVAHTLRADFPGGQLYLDLAGTSENPHEPADLLAEVLRTLGVSGAALPDSVHERAALFRSLLAERRMLVLLDDAASLAQVRPLLPASCCAVLITSRRRITELPGAHHVELDVLPAEDALRLLGRIATPERVNQEQESALAILRSCGHLPLAIRIAGARLAGRRGWSLRVLEERLSDESQRLTELRVGDLEVRASFDLSMRLLPEDAAQAFRLLGLLGPQSIPAWVVDVLLDREGSAAALDALVDANLVRLTGTDPIGQPRYRLHDLVRCYAQEAADTDPEPDRRAALARLLGAWLATAEAVGARLPANIFSLIPTRATRHPLAPTTLARLVAAPVAWFDAECDTLLAAVRLAAESAMDELAWGLAVALVPYFDLRSHYDAWTRSHLIALEAVRAAGNLRGEAALLRGLAQVHLYRDAYDESERCFARSYALFQEVGDARGEAIAICGLGAVQKFRDRHAAALVHFQQALAMFLAAGDLAGQAYAWQAIGRGHLDAGNLTEARQALNEALRLSQLVGDQHREGYVLTQLGRLHRMTGDPQRAMSCLRHALAVFDAFGDSHCAAYALHNLGGLHAALGDREGGAVELERSLAIFRQLGDRHGEASAAQALGELHRDEGRIALAEGHLHHALALWHGLRATDRIAATEAHLAELGNIEPTDTTTDRVRPSTPV